jgi:hypothetical protein
MTNEAYGKLFSQIEAAEPSAGLLDRVLLAIKKEQRRQQARKLAFVLVLLLVVSVAATSFSWTILVGQLAKSGFIYFIKAALSDFATFLSLWQDFGLAVLESLPILGLVALMASIGLFVFTLRWFLREKDLLAGYFSHNFNLI